MKFQRTGITILFTTMPGSTLGAEEIPLREGDLRTVHGGDLVKADCAIRIEKR